MSVSFMLYNGRMTTVHSPARPLLIIEHEAECPPGILANAAKEIGVPLEVRRPYLSDPLPGIKEVQESFSGIIIMGGGMGPLEDEKYPWLRECRALCLEAIRHRVLLLGICLGEELLGAAIGSAITRRAQPEIGLVPVTLTRAASHDPLCISASLNSPGLTFNAFQWHQEQVGTLPPHPEGLPDAHTEVLAVNAEGDIEAFRVGNKAWAVQFHPEITEDIAAAWARTSTLKPAEMTPESYREQIRTWRTASPQADLPARLLAAFVRLAKSETTASDSLIA